MRRLRPRLSLLTALLLITIAGMALVVARLWREVGPLRAELCQLRNEVGRLSIDDPTKIHAIEVRTNEPLFWKWRVWVPEGTRATVSAQWGRVPAIGLPTSVPAHGLVPGEQWITMRAMRDAKDETWYARLETKTWSTHIPIDEQSYWWNWPIAGILISGVRFETAAEDKKGEPLVLTRYRTEHSNGSVQLQSSNAPSAGFIIW